MSTATQFESHPEANRARAIRDLVARGDLDLAKARLLAFAREVGVRELEDAAVLLAQRLASVNRENLQTGKDVSVERAEIARTLLALLGDVEDRHAKNPAPDDSKESRGARTNLSFLRTKPDDGAVSPRRTGPRDRSRLAEARRAFAQSEVAAPDTAVVRCVNVGRHFKRGRAPFQLTGVTLTLLPGQITGLIGENGAGKSTLLHIVAGELANTEGELSYPRLGRTGDWRTIRSAIAYIEQQPSPWYGPVHETLHLTAACAGVPYEENQREVDFWIYRMGLERYRDSLWSELSGGYKVRFELARALLMRPALLILDEPLAALDVIAQGTFLQDLRDLTDDRIGPESMLVSSQHLHEVELIADQLLFLRQGTTVFSGAPRDLNGRWSDYLTEICFHETPATVQDMLVELGAVGVELQAGRYLVKTSHDLPPERLLQQLLARGVGVRYFHDISSSTRRLFEKDGQT